MIELFHFVTFHKSLPDYCMLNCLHNQSLPLKSFLLLI